MRVPRLLVMKRTGLLNFLNVGCGDTFHPEWTNVDMVSHSPHVRAYNLLKGLPYPDHRFEAVYHSHVLEHFPREKAADFIRECFRVLKPGGIIRVVVPDLEDIVREYIKHLHDNLEHPSRQAEARYDWIMVELYDQTVRNRTGGQMGEFARRLQLADPEYLTARIGRRDPPEENKQHQQGFGLWIKLILRKSARQLARIVRGGFRRVFVSETRRIGALRLGGEIHMWMYDRYSLARLLKENGFEVIQAMGPSESGIPGWSKYELDVKNGEVRFPTSLFMEARRPR